MTPPISGPSPALDIPPGPRMRARLVQLDGDDSGRARMAANLLLMGDGEPDGLAVAHVLLSGPAQLAAWAASTWTLPHEQAATEIETKLEAIVDTARLTVAEAIALRCHHLGVTKAFAYPGTSELSLCHAFAGLKHGVLVNSRGDREAVFMAGGAALGGMRPTAVAIVHGARGLTNAAGAIGDLRRNEVPALIVVGLPATRSAEFLPPHGEDRLIETIGTLAKAHRRVLAPRGANGLTEVVASIDDAFSAASALPRGPVVVGVPQDVLEARTVPVSRLGAPPPGEVRHSVDPRSMRRARALLRGASSPVLLVDDYIFRHERSNEVLAQLADRLGAHVFQVAYRRGPMLFQQLRAQDSSCFAGLYQPESAEHRSRMAGADLLVTVEDRNVYRRVVGDLPSCPKIAITSHPEKAKRNGYLSSGDLLLAGDPVRTLEQLLEAAGVRQRRAPTSYDTKRDGFEPEGSPTHLRDSLAQLTHDALAISGATRVVDDSQMVGGALAQVYESAFGGVIVHGDHGGFVGAGPPLATGLAIAHATPVLCLAGDQGFTNGSQALVAAAQENAPVLFLVFNNGESVSLRKQTAALDAPGDLPPDYDRLLNNPPAFSYVAAATAAG